MKIKLTPEQVEDAQKMATSHDLPNFSKAGTGKTHTALEAMRLTGAKRNLILCPRIALDWWTTQAKEYLDADVTLFDKSSRTFGGDIIVSTYDLVRNNSARFYEWSDGGNLILDESHHVAGIGAKRTQTIFGAQADLVGGLVERFDQVWPMSGTPKMNYANDYWTQCFVLHPEVCEKHGIKDYDTFCKTFTYKTKKQYHPKMPPQWVISGDTNQLVLSNMLYKEVGCIRRVAAPNMPKLRQRELVVPVTIDRSIAKSLREMSTEDILKTINDKDSIAAKAWKIVGLGKVPEVVPYVGDSAKESPVLLGCWHREVMAAYEEELKRKGLRVKQVHGGTASYLLPRIRDEFNDGKIDVLIGQMKAMGVSWNLQEASNHVIIAEVHPTPAVRDQFYARVYRRGQERDCTVDDILSKTQIDEALYGVRLRKEQSDVRING